MYNTWNTKTAAAHTNIASSYQSSSLKNVAIAQANKVTHKRSPQSNSFLVVVRTRTWSAPRARAVLCQLCIKLCIPQYGRWMRTHTSTTIDHTRPAHGHHGREGIQQEWTSHDASQYIPWWWLVRPLWGCVCPHDIHEQEEEALNRKSKECAQYERGDQYVYGSQQSRSEGSRDVDLDCSSRRCIRVILFIFLFYYYNELLVSPKYVHDTQSTSTFTSTAPTNRSSVNSPIE